VLDLVQPSAAGGQLIGFGGEARRDEPGREGTPVRLTLPTRAASRISGKGITPIRRMSHENPTWGASRIHGELVDYAKANPGKLSFASGNTRAPARERGGAGREFIESPRVDHANCMGKGLIISSGYSKP
jgi:hypothetical protein